MQKQLEEGKIKGGGESRDAGEEKNCKRVRASALALNAASAGVTETMKELPVWKPMLSRSFPIHFTCLSLPHLRPADFL